MKASKRILATLLSLCLVLGCVSITVFAADPAPIGSITIQNQSGSNATVGGKDFNVFKIFNATTNANNNIAYQWIKHTDGSNLFESFFFGDDTILENGVQKYTSLVPGGTTIEDVVLYIDSLKGNSFEFSQMAAKLHQYIHDYNDEYPEKKITTSAEARNIDAQATFYTFDGLSLGYYLVYDCTTIASGESAVRSAAMLTHPGQNKTIYLKADRPHIEKHVFDDDSVTNNWQLGTTASIGDVVKFRLVTAVPDHDLYGNNYTFTISDVMSDGLLYKDGSLKIEHYENDATTPYIDDEDDDGDGNLEALVYDAPVFDATPDSSDITINFTNIPQIDKDSLIIIYYEATVLNTAALKNENTVTLTYSNDPNNDSYEGNVDATAFVSLWQSTITKYIESTEGVPSYMRLPGAEFEIYSKAEDGELTKLAFTTTTTTRDLGENKVVSFTKYTFDPTGAGETTIKTLDGGENVDDGSKDAGYTAGGILGQALLYGLGEGTYVIRETKAPAGYQQAKGDFEFVVSDTIGQSGSIANAEVAHTRNIRPGQFTRVLVDEANHIYHIGITNAPGSALPETGGMGTTIFTVLGVILMAGAVAFFTSRKRSSVA